MDERDARTRGLFAHALADVQREAGPAGLGHDAPRPGPPSVDDVDPFARSGASDGGGVVRLGPVEDQGRSLLGVGQVVADVDGRRHERILSRSFEKNEELC